MKEQMKNKITTEKYVEELPKLLIDKYENI